MQQVNYLKIPVIFLNFENFFKNTALQNNSAIKFASFLKSLVVFTIKKSGTKPLYKFFSLNSLGVLLVILLKVLLKVFKFS